MKRQNKYIFTYFLIFAMILFMLRLSHQTSNTMRGNSIAFFAPLWEKILTFQHFLFHPSQPSPFSSLSIEEELQRLQLEKHLLEIELSYLQKQLDEYSLLASQIAQTDLPERLAKTMKYRLQAIPARVVFRSLDMWNNALWINVGSKDETIIAINSPVVLGKAIVGIIDYVGDHQSRVRLITDHRLNPSVRAARGGEQEAVICTQIESLLQQINRKKLIDQQAIKLLEQLKENLQPLKKTWYLAKGELLGISSLQRLSPNISLKGTGFNYDFSDEEGESRDLYTGKSSSSTIPILKINDVLVTTGMDGLFPQGFQVAIVTRVEPLKEGDYFYELEARPIAIPLEELSLVFVLPPLSQ